MLESLRKKGVRETTIYTTLNQLKHLAKYSDLHNPEAIKAFIAKKHSDNYKQRLVVAYNMFAEYYKIEWEMPRYQTDEKMPRLPTEEQIKTLIAGAGKKLALRLRLLMETGIRPIELCNLKTTDLNTNLKAITPTTAKHGSARILKISDGLCQDLQTHIAQKNLKLTDPIFGKSTSRHVGTHYREMRKTLANKLHRPDLLTIRLYDFRHFFATMTYMKTRDMVITANSMGHKDYNTTRKYMHLSRILELTDSDQWICKAVQTKDEAKPLIESGYQYINTTPDGFMLYRKPK